MIGQTDPNDDTALLEDVGVLYAPEGKEEPALSWEDAWRAWSRETGRPIPPELGIR